MKNIIRWFFGIVIIMASFQISFLLLSIAVFLIPPLDSFIANKLNIRLSGLWKTIICAVLFFISIGIYSQSNEYKKYEAEQEQSRIRSITTKNAIKPTGQFVVTLAQNPSKPALQETKQQTNQDELSEESVKAQVIKLEGSSQRVMGKKELSRVEVIGDFRVIEENEINPKTKIISVFYKPKDLWDEKVLLKLTASTTVAVSELFFANPKVSTVRVTALADFTDSYGKSGEQKAVQIEIYKETANKVNWKKMKEMTLVDYNKLLNIADDVYIHPGVKSKL